MAHLNCLSLRAAGINYWFFFAGPSGGGCWYKAKSEMLPCKIDGEMSVQNCGFSAKLRNGDGDDMLHRLTATAVITDSRHRFTKRWHVADVKNIAGYNQNGPMVHRNYANIACTFRFYAGLRLRDRDRCSAADDSGAAVATHPHHRILKRWHVATSKTSLDMTRQP